MSLENRFGEFPHLANTKDEESYISNVPRPAQVTGTLTVKLVGVEGLVDMGLVREASDPDALSPHRASSSSLFSHIMTLPRSRTTSSPHINFDRDKMESDNGSNSPYNSNTLAWHRPRGGSRHNKAKAHLQKHHSNQDLLEDTIGMLVTHCTCTCMVKTPNGMVELISMVTTCMGNWDFFI